MTILRRTITFGLIATAATGGVMALAPAALAETGLEDKQIRPAGVHAVAEDDQVRLAVASRSGASATR